jgi:hypothetical protein
MPADLFLPTIDLDFFYPPFLQRLLLAKARARERGAEYLTTYGWRSYGESHELNLKYKAGGPRAAPAGYSGHNFGLASDEALIIKPSPKRVLRWGRGERYKEPDDYVIFAEEAEKLGLHHGKEFLDWPHFEWPGFVSGAELAPLRKIWQAGDGLLLLPRLRKVWEYVDSHSPAMPPI